MTRTKVAVIGSGNGLLSAFGMGWIVGNDLASSTDHSEGRTNE